MRDRCVIRRVLRLDTDRATGKVTPVYAPDPVYSGRCKLTSYEGHETERQVADATLTLQRLSLHLPVGVYEARVGDVIDITRSVDPRLTGRQYRIAQEAPYRSWATADRIYIDALAD